MIDIVSSFHDEVEEPVNRQNVLYPTWDYFLSVHNMQEIIPGVYLGPYSAAQLHCLASLLERDVRYIICVRQDIEAHFIKPQISDPTFTYLTLDIADNVTENIIRFFPKVKEFIDDALSKNYKVLVHGNTGNSRSATLVLAYIMEKFGLNTFEALQFAREKRATINPNEGFKAQLVEYEPIYKARQLLSNGEPSLANTNRQKRKSEELSESIDCDLIPPPPSPVMDNNNCENCPPTITEFSSHLYSLWLKKC